MSLDLDGVHAGALHREHGQLLALGQGPADLPVVHQVVRSDQQQGQTLSGSTGGSTAAVDVRLSGAGNLKPTETQNCETLLSSDTRTDRGSYLIVDHVLDVRDVQASSSDVRGEENTAESTHRTVNTPTTQKTFRYLRATLAWFHRQGL